MGEVVNLRTVRKAKVRRADEARAAANRALHGRTKAERLAEEAGQARAQALLDGAKRED